MVRSAAALIARDGWQAAGLREIADHAAAPRGSIRHYFPGGKDQLTRESLAWIGGVVAGLLERTAQTADPGTVAVSVLDAFVASWREDLVDTGIGTGCSVAAVVHDSDDPALLSCAAAALV